MAFWWRRRVWKSGSRRAVHQGGVLQALVAGDQLGFHGGVEVVLLDPVGDALGEGVVVERVAELGDGAVDFEDLVDGAGVVGAFGADEADVVGRELGVFEPGAEEVVAAADAEGCGFGRGGEGELLHLAGELGRGALVGVEEEDPGVFEGDGGEGGVAVGGVVVEGAGVDLCSGGFGDLDGGVGAVGVEDVDVVGPGDAGETAGQVLLLVAGEDEDGDHLRLWYPVRAARTISGWLKANDEAAGEGLGVVAVAGAVDAVAEVDDAPVDVGNDGCVEADDVAVGKVVGEVGGIGGDAKDKFAVRLQGQDGDFDGDTRTKEATVDVVGEIAASVRRDIERADVVEAVVEAEGSAELPYLTAGGRSFRCRRCRRWRSVPERGGLW